MQGGSIIVGAVFSVLILCYSECGRSATNAVPRGFNKELSDANEYIEELADNRGLEYHPDEDG